MKPSPWSATLLDGRRPPFGTASGPHPALSIDLERDGYVEEEYLLSGSAGTWDTAAVGSPVRRERGIRYRTRVLVRRPRSPHTASGVTHVEPLHPHRDAGLTWDALAPHLMRRGDAWVGVTLFPDVARLMRERIDPERYRTLLVPGAGTEWDILADALSAVRENALGRWQSGRIVLSGWSATGSICRVFTREGFAASRGGLADAVAIVISSGGAGPAGYPALSPTSAPVALTDPRRTVRGIGVPTFEILSETESETHRGQLRDDSDEPGGVYRLYQMAASAHIENWPGTHSTHVADLEAAGIEAGDITVRERRTDGRSDLVVRALMDRLVESIDGRSAPRAPRFAYEAGDVPAERMLRRDADGNVLGGIRPPWIEAPLAAYAPHGTAASRAAGPDWTPLADADLGARLTGTMQPLSAAEVGRRYADEADYVRRFTVATEALVAARMLCREDSPELLASAAQRWQGAAGGEKADV